MKVFLFIILLALPAQLIAQDTVKKWTDSKGTTHYGDKKAAKNVTFQNTGDLDSKPETLEIDQTFDQKSYDEGIKRHEETQDFADNLEKERLEEEEKQRELEANRTIKYPPPSGGTTILIPDAVYPDRYGYGRPINRPGRPTNPVERHRPVNRPAR